MSYTEGIHIQSLADNHTLVDFQFSLSDDVHVQCEGATVPRTCSTEVNLLPLHVLGLMTQSKASHISFHSPSGQWNEHMWGAKPTDRAKHRHLINSDGTHSTALAANTHISNYPTLRAYLSTLLGAPLNPSGVDTSQHPLKVSKSPTFNGTEGALHPDSGGEYVQFFPLLGANADKWSLWSKHLLPCGGKSGIAALLDSHALHGSLWYSLTLNIHTTHNNTINTATTKPVASSADSKSVLSRNGGLDAVDETHDGVYSVHMTVSVSMVVPIIMQETTQRIPHNTQHTTNNILTRVQQATSNTNGIYNKKCSTVTAKPTLTYNTDVITNINVPVNSGDSTNKSTIDELWHAVYIKNTYNADNYRSRSTANTNAMSGDCNQELTMHRKLFDSRSMEFKVVTTIQSPTTHTTHSMTHNTHCAHHYTEPLADTYTIDLSTYRYILLTPSIQNDITSSNTEGLVRDLPGFYQVHGDCTSQFANMGSTRHCIPSYTFPLPTIPPDHTLLLTYTATKRLLSREHQPIDASRGVVVQPAVLYSCAVGGSGSTERCSIQSTASFIVLSPIPDGSMPFNVITMVSTLLAFFLGSFINALLKNGKKKQVETEGKEIPVPVALESTAE